MLLLRIAISITDSIVGIISMSVALSPWTPKGLNAMLKHEVLRFKSWDVRPPILRWSFELKRTVCVILCTIINILRNLKLNDNHWFSSNTEDPQWNCSRGQTFFRLGILSTKQLQKPVRYLKQLADWTWYGTQIKKHERCQATWSHLGDTDIYLVIYTSQSNALNTFWNFETCTNLVLVSVSYQGLLKVKIKWSISSFFS